MGLDRGVRTIVDAARPDSLVIFLGDNGNAENAPLRGRKGEFYEGGVRVPFLVRWAGCVAAGRTVDAPVSAVDVAATVLAAVGAPVPAEFDGVNLLAPVPPERPIIFADPLRRGYAVRQGAWKFVEGYRGQPEQLFNIVADKGETTDLAAGNPLKVAELRAMIAAWRSRL